MGNIKEKARCKGISQNLLKLTAKIVIIRELCVYLPKEYIHNGKKILK